MELDQDRLRAYLQDKGFSKSFSNAIMSELGGVFSFVRNIDIVLEKGLNSGLGLMHSWECFEFALAHKDSILRWMAAKIAETGANPLSTLQLYYLCNVPMAPSEHIDDLIWKIIEDLAHNVQSAREHYHGTNP
jgi:hypothetical protein